jgi:hypothetical protein
VYEKVPATDGVGATMVSGVWPTVALTFAKLVRVVAVRG